MTIYGSNYNTYNSSYPVHHIAFKEQYNGAQIFTKPIEKVEGIVSNTVDSFVSQEEQDEETKKSNKTAIKAISATLVLGTFVALLNPKFLGKLSSKLKTWAAKAGNKANNSLSGKLYRRGEYFLNKTVKVLEFSNNINSAKDEAFKLFCTGRIPTGRIKNNKVKTFADKCNSLLSKTLQSPHATITKWFDNISKQTVYKKYGAINKEMSSLETIIARYKANLSPLEKQLLETKINELRTVQTYFSKDNTAKRLLNQENIMNNLEDETLKRMKEYGSQVYNYVGGKNKNSEYFKNNLDFWAEQILMPQRNQLEKEGTRVVNILVGDGKTAKGTYDEILDILTPHMKKEEKAIFENRIKKLETDLRKANKSECIEYFDKKRDLILGSAPTDILTALAGIAFSGIAIGTADNKEERISRAVTLGFPVIAGLGVSMATTAMLYSGIQGMAIGSASSFGLSKIGSYADKHFVKKNKPASNNEGEVHSA